jgi:hypothetical protein
MAWTIPGRNVPKVFFTDLASEFHGQRLYLKIQFPLFLRKHSAFQYVISLLMLFKETITVYSESLIKYPPWAKLRLAYC